MRISNIAHYIKRIQISNNKSTDTKLYDVPTPTISEYMENRFKPQLQWYENKARDNMLRFRILRISIIVLALLTSIINAVGLSGNNNMKGTQLFTAIVTAVILGLTSLLQLTKSQEDWILFRVTAEKLKSEYQLFMHNAKPYSDAADDMGKNKLFVERLENLYLTEGSEFTSSHKQAIDQKPNEVNH